jgi:hypothetical protein
MFAPQKLKPVASYTKYMAIIIYVYVLICKYGAKNEPLGTGFMNATLLFLVVIVWV